MGSAHDAASQRTMPRGSEHIMRARVLNAFGYSNTLDALVAHLRAETIPAAARPGDRGMLVLGEHRTDHVIIVTFWHRGIQERSTAHGAFIEEQLRGIAPFIGLRTTHEAFDVLVTRPEARSAYE